MRNAKLIKSERDLAKRDLHSRIKKLKTGSCPVVNLLGNLAISSVCSPRVLEVMMTSS